MNSTKIKNLFFGILIALCTFVCGMAIIPTNNQISVKAEDATIPSYFSASVQGENNVNYQDGQTILLKEGETFVLKLGNGKSLNLSSHSDFNSFGLTTDDFATLDGNPDATQFYPLDLSLSSITVTRDEQKVELEELLGSTSPIKNIHYFGYDYDGTSSSSNHKVFEYLNIELSLSNENFKTGKYTFTFNDYYEFSGTDYITSTAKSFSVTFYIFSETEYLTTAGEANVIARNVRTENLASSSRTYQRNYFFNYQNQNSNTTNTLNLPTLTFAGNRFYVTIQKSFQGKIENATIYYNGTNAVVEGDKIVLTKLTDNKNIEITFNDLGEYVLNYHFIYLMDGHTITSITEFETLSNTTINSIKPNKLDIYGYQIYYNDINKGKAVEFKLINENNIVETDENNFALSADITYKNVVGTDNIVSTSEGQTIINIDPTTTKPQSTNQAPISFKFNASLNNAILYRYDTEDSIDAWDSGTEWSNNSITDNGIYLLKVDYSYDNNITSGTINTNTIYTQYFYFEITTETPKPNTFEIVDGVETALGSGAYTKNEVQVYVNEQSVFNSPIRLVVQAKDYTASNYSDLTPNADGKYYLTENKNYKVILYYGANYDQNTAKNRVSYFTIDNNPITGLGFKVATKGQGSTYSKGSVIDFFTNTYATFEWAEKASGATTTAYYKYIPFTTSTTTDNPNSTNFNNTATKTFFDNNNALRNGYKLDLSANLIETLYNNTANKSVVSDTNVLTRQGLYIFQVTDLAGNVAYSAVVIDNTSPLILQRINDTYEEIKPYNVISADAKIDWGQYKLIGTGLNQSSIENIDEWLKIILESKLANSNDFQYFTDGNLYLCPEISATSYVLLGNTYNFLNNRYSYNIYFLQDNIANETNYTFYIIDESNQYFNSLTSEHFVNDSSAIFNVKISSDASGADILVNTADLSNLNTSLSEVGTTDSYQVIENQGVYTINRNYINTRIKYYMATGIRENSNEDVNQFIYIFKPNPNDNIMVEKVVLYYYPFVKSTSSGYTIYKLSDTYQSVITIYDRNESSNPITPLSGEYEGYYYYSINVSYINQAYRTLEGKYVIERTYTEETENYLQSTATNDKYDYAVRKNVFIVDRQNIVSSPETIDNEYKSLIGQHIYISMLEENESQTFNEIYRAYANSDANIAILETNKLPIKIHVPNYKFVTGSKNAVKPINELSYFYYSEDTINRVNYYYGDFSPKTENGEYIKVDDNGNVIADGNPIQNLARTNFSGVSQSANFKANVANTSFDLSVKIEYSTNNSSYTLFENLTTTSNNYFISSDITTAGFYKITITQNPNNPIYPNVQTSISFIIEIVNIAPEFAFTTTNGESLNTYPSGDPTAVTYFNGETVRVTWSDPTSEYLAKIDRVTDENKDGLADKIYYYTSNDPSTLHYIPFTSIYKGTTLNSYYFDIDVSNIANGSSIFVHMEYEGKDYNNGYHSITRQLYIDRLAPISKLQSLADKTELNGNQFAEYARRFVNLEETENIYGLSVGNIGTYTSYKYNISTATGALAYYSFIVTPEELKNFVTPSNISNGYNEGYYYYCKPFDAGSKYNINQYWQETSVVNAQNAIASHSLITSSTVFNTNTYYEIIELDLAGNISIYTVYVLDTNDETIKNISMLTAYGNNPNGNGNVTFTDYNLNLLSSASTQNIYSRNYFTVSNLSLYNFNSSLKGYFVFSVGNVIYLSSPYLEKNTFYNISSWSGSATTSPTTVTLSEILNMNVSISSDYRQLKIQDSARNEVYTFNLYCSGEELSVTLVPAGEGITIASSGYLNLNSISISEWNPNTLVFIPIYTATGTYNSNEFVKTTVNTNAWTFMIDNPSNVAYKYSFQDNFGKIYSISHTYGTTVINDAVTGEIAQITDSNHTLWYYGITSMNFYYNLVDYRATISAEYLTVQNSKFTFQPILNNVSVVIPTSNTANIYYSSQSPSNDRTIGIITLKTPTDILSSLPFTGGVYKFTITLTNENDNSTQIYNLIINTLKPTINLYDKNDENKNGLFDSYAIFSGQLRIDYSNLSNYIDPSVDTSFFFPYEITLQFGNGEESILNSGTFVDEVGTYTIRIYGNLNGRHLLETKTFTISDSKKDFYQLAYFDETSGNYKPAIETGNPYTTQGGTSYPTHYIVNSSYEFYVNEEQDITITEIGTPEIREGTTTRFYQISNYSSKNPNINYYQKTIAVTTVPKSSSIINNFTYFNSNGLETQFTGISLSIIASVDDQELDSLNIMWDSYYLIKENKISVEIKYGSNAENVYDTSKVTQSGEKSSISLNLSGEYTITFKDLAGNIQTFTHPTFGYQSQSYTLTFIKNVVFTTNGESPIPNSIFNDQVIVAIPESTTDYYDTGYQPVIHAEKNGVEYEILKQDGVYTFTEPGYYEVYFTARINGVDVREEGSNFTIINKNETRWAFEYSEYENYEIISVLKDGTSLDLTKSSKYVIYNEGTDDEYVAYKNIMISLYDEKTGAGRYQITIRTNGELENQSFTFEFWINDAEIPIEVSVPEGTSTTDVITVTYNPYNIYSNAGDCSIVIGNQVIPINAENSSPTVEEAPIKNAGTYFIQILTDSGRLLYSYKVIKVAPLSTLAIILIVVACVVVVGLVIVMILLRKKMKIR